MVSPKCAEWSKNTEKLQKVGYWCLEHTHAHHRWAASQPRVIPSDSHYDLSIMVLGRRGLVSHPSVIVSHYLTYPHMYRIVTSSLLHPQRPHQALTICLTSINHTDHTASSSTMQYCRELYCVHLLGSTGPVIHCPSTLLQC